MRPGIPSRTAYGVAIRRAAHQVLDQPAIFEDPVAAKVIGREAHTALLGRRELATVADEASRQLRLFVAARSRYAEDELARFVAEGVRQYVVLGAGLDTFAYRNPYSGYLRVFEVDHPDTQAWKREQVQAAGIEVSTQVTFLPADFEKQKLATILENAPEFDDTSPVFFSLLGVTSYLTAEAFTETLRAVASMQPRSGIVFDYAVSREGLNLADATALRRLAARVAEAGEKFQLFLRPHTLSLTLQEMGFTCVKDLGQNEINSRYFQDRVDGLRMENAIGRLASATI